VNFSAIGRQSSFRVVYADILYTVVTFILPFIVLSVFSVLLIRVYRAQRRRRAAMRTPNSSVSSPSAAAAAAKSSSNEHSVTRVIVVVMVVFAVCNLPAKVFENAGASPACGTVAYVARRLSFVLEVANSAANFVVYCALRHQFRDGLRRALSPRQRQRHSRGAGTTNSGGAGGGRRGWQRRVQSDTPMIDLERVQQDSQRIIVVDINDDPSRNLEEYTPSVRLDENTV